MANSPLLTMPILSTVTLKSVPLTPAPINNWANVAFCFGQTSDYIIRCALELKYGFIICIMARYHTLNRPGYLDTFSFVPQYSIDCPDNLKNWGESFFNRSKLVYIANRGPTKGDELLVGRPFYEAVSNFDRWTESFHRVYGFFKELDPFDPELVEFDYISTSKKYYYLSTIWLPRITDRKNWIYSTRNPNVLTKSLIGLYGVDHPPGPSSFILSLPNYLYSNFNEFPYWLQKWPDLQYVNPIPQPDLGGVPWTVVPPSEIHSPLAKLKGWIKGQNKIYLTDGQYGAEINKFTSFPKTSREKFLRLWEESIIGQPLENWA